jgi:hypothetical protein
MKTESGKDERRRTIRPVRKIAISFLHQPFMQTGRMKKSMALLLMPSALMLGAASDREKFAEAARDLDAMIAERYAYLDKLPEEGLPHSDALSRERNGVHDQRSLLAYAEKRIVSLADHHAHTGSSFRDSWALVPTYTDIWIVQHENRYVVDAVRYNSPAARAGVKSGDVIERAVAHSGMNSAYRRHRAGKNTLPASLSQDDGIAPGGSVSEAVSLPCAK